MKHVYKVRGFSNEKNENDETKQENRKWKWEWEWVVENKSRQQQKYTFNFLSIIILELVSIIYFILPIAAIWALFDILLHFYRCRFVCILWTLYSTFHCCFWLKHFWKWVHLLMVNHHLSCSMAFETDIYIDFSVKINRIAVHSHVNVQLAFWHLAWNFIASKE